MFKKIFVIGFGLMGLATSSFALSTAPSSYQSLSYRSAVVAIINQLQSVKPLITQAEKSAPKHARVVLHFERWQDRDGQWHSGLRDDINAIQNALIQALNQTPVGPRPIASLKADFVGGLS